MNRLEKQFAEIHNSSFNIIHSLHNLRFIFKRLTFSHQFSSVFVIVFVYLLYIDSRTACIAAISIVHYTHLLSVIFSATTSRSFK